MNHLDNVTHAMPFVAGTLAFASVAPDAIPVHQLSLQAQSLLPLAQFLAAVLSSIAAVLAIVLAFIKIYRTVKSNG